MDINEFVFHIGSRWQGIFTCHKICLQDQQICVGPNYHLYWMSAPRRKQNEPKKLSQMCPVEFLNIRQIITVQKYLFSHLISNKFARGIKSCNIKNIYIRMYVFHDFKWSDKKMAIFSFNRRKYAVYTMGSVKIQIIFMKSMLDTHSNIFLGRFCYSQVCAGWILKYTVSFRVPGRRGTWTVQGKCIILCLCQAKTWWDVSGVGTGARKMWFKSTGEGRGKRACNTVANERVQ